MCVCAWPPQTNVTDIAAMAEVVLVVVPAYYPGRDFEVMCATEDMSVNDTAATHIHLQLVACKALSRGLRPLLRAACAPVRVARCG